MDYFVYGSCCQTRKRVKRLMDNQTQKKVKQNTSSLIILALVFFGPIIFAWYLYNFQPQWFLKRMNHGKLLDFPLQMKDLDWQGQEGERKKLRGKWLLLYVTPLPCKQLCLGNLYKMRQVRLALSGDSERVERAVLTFSGDGNDPSLKPLLIHHYTGTLEIRVKPLKLQAFFVGFPHRDTALREGYLFIVDPHGNVILSYPPDASMQGVWKDLTRLLKVSKIG